MLLFDLLDPISYSLLVEAETSQAHRDSRLLLPVIDLDAHISRRTLQHVVGKSFLLLLLLYIVARIESCKVWILPRRCQETHIELSVSVDHLHLLAELCHEKHRPLSVSR